MITTHLRVKSLELPLLLAAAGLQGIRNEELEIASNYKFKKEK